MFEQLFENRADFDLMRDSGLIMCNLLKQGNYLQLFIHKKVGALTQPLRLFFVAHALAHQSVSELSRGEVRVPVEIALELGRRQGLIQHVLSDLSEGHVVHCLFVNLSRYANYFN